MGKKQVELPEQTIFRYPKPRGDWSYACGWCYWVWDHCFITKEETSEWAKKHSELCSQKRIEDLVN